MAELSVVQLLEIPFFRNVTSSSVAVVGNAAYNSEICVSYIEYDIFIRRQTNGQILQIVQ